MDLRTTLAAIVTFVSGGSATFVDKLAASRIGAQTAIWHSLGFTPLVVVYGLIAYKLENLVQADRIGIRLGLLGSAVASVGGIAFYALLTRSEASSAVPLMALHPAFTVLLAFVFLHESVVSQWLLGIALSLWRYTC